MVSPCRTPRPSGIVSVKLLGQTTLNAQKRKIGLFGGAVRVAEAGRALIGWSVDACLSHLVNVPLSLVYTRVQ